MSSFLTLKALNFFMKTMVAKGFFAHPAFRPKMSLCHRVASVVCPQITRNASPHSVLIRFQFSLVCLKELGPVH